MFIYRVGDLTAREAARAEAEAQTAELAGPGRSARSDRLRDARPAGRAGRRRGPHPARREDQPDRAALDPGAPTRRSRRSQLESIEPKQPSENKQYPETRAEVRLKGTSLAQAVDFLYRIETSQSHLIVRSLKMRTPRRRGRRPGARRELLGLELRARLSAAAMAARRARWALARGCFGSASCACALRAAASRCRSSGGATGGVRRGRWSLARPALRRSREPPARARATARARRSTTCARSGHLGRADRRAVAAGTPLFRGEGCCARSAASLRAAGRRARVARGRSWPPTALRGKADGIWRFGAKRQRRGLPVSRGAIVVRQAGLVRAALRAARAHRRPRVARRRLERPLRRRAGSAALGERRGHDRRGRRAGPLGPGPRARGARALALPARSTCRPGRCRCALAVEGR